MKVAAATWLGLFLALFGVFLIRQGCFYILAAAISRSDGRTRSSRSRSGRS